MKVGRIDFERQTISVAQQVTRGAGGRSVLGPPKSAAGRRTLAAPADLVALLTKHLERRDLTVHDVDAFVFTSSSGKHLHYSNWLHRTWYPARERAGLEWLQFHDLRRANATAMVLDGVDVKTAQTRLGHSDPRLTLAIYAQATGEGHGLAAEKLGARLMANHQHPSRTR